MRKLVPTLLLMFIPCMAFALATPNVDITDRVYKDIDILIAAKLISPTIVGQRPYARSAIAKMIEEAVKNRDSWNETDQKRVSYIDSVISDLRSEYVDELEPSDIVIHPLKTAKAENVYIKGDMESIYPNNGVGRINAKLFPLESYREGRNFSSGYQTFIETEHSLQLSKYFSLYLKPSFLLAEDANAYIQNLYADFEVKNFQFEIGRDSLVFGQGQYGPLLLSNNARPLDLVKITNPSPTTLPWIFKYIGPVRYTLFVSNLGPDQPLEYPYFCGYKVSILPFHLLELGFSHTVMMGGDGAPKLSAWDVIGEFIGFRPGGTSSSSQNKTNHQMEADIALTIPPLNFTRMYFALNNEDKRDTLERFLKDGSAYLGGIFIPRLSRTGNNDLRIEYYHTSPIHYRHSLYNYGYTLNNNIIGSALGSQADGVHVEYHQDLMNDKRLDLTGTFDWESRGSNIYEDSRDPDGSTGDLVVKKHQPSEERFRFAIKHRYPFNEYLLLESRIAYEHILNKNYVSGRSGNDALVSFNITYSFDRFTRYKK